MIKRRKPLRRQSPIRTQRSILKRLKPQGAKGKLRAQQRLAHKLAYCKAHGRKEADIWGGPCQSHGGFLFINRSDFSHKVPAGRGGDKGGQVQASNGIYSCRPCHAFAEQDRQAREELVHSDASCTTGGIVQWSREVLSRLTLFRMKYHG